MLHTALILRSTIETRALFDYLLSISDKLAVEASAPDEAFEAKLLQKIPNSLFSTMHGR